MCIIEQSPTLIVLMGLQASGKTSFFERHLKDRGYVHINLDTQKTRNRELLEVTRCLESGLSYVIDNTNPTKEDRRRYIEPAKDKGYHLVGYFMQSKLADCLERNNRRERQVPKKGILATFNKIEMPSLDEGFDELNFVSIEDGEFRISKWIENEI